MSNVVCTGRDFVEARLSMSHMGCVHKAGCGQMYRRYLFSYGGLTYLEQQTITINTSHEPLHLLP